MAMVARKQRMRQKGVDRLSRDILPPTGYLSHVPSYFESIKRLISIRPCPQHPLTLPVPKAYHLATQTQCMSSQIYIRHLRFKPEQMFSLPREKETVQPTYKGVLRWAVRYVLVDRTVSYSVSFSIYPAVSSLKDLEVRSQSNPSPV